MIIKMDRYRTRSVTVLAIQYDGSNLSELERAISIFTRRDVSLSAVMDVGCWLVVQGRGYTVLPDKAFTRVYEPDNDLDDLMMNGEHVFAGQSATSSTKSCFSCVHYDIDRSTCTLFNDPVYDEFDAASDCSAYEVGDW